MIRALWEDLLVRARALPRATWRRAAVLLLCGLGFYALFFGLLYAREQAATRLAALSRAAVVMGISFEQPRLSCFPPAVSLGALRLPQRPVSGGAEQRPGLTLRDVRLELLFFPARLVAQARVAGGMLRARLIPATLFRTDSCVVRVELEGLDLAELSHALGGGALLRISGGSLSGACDVSLPLRNGRPVFNDSEGDLALTLHGAALDHSLPMLRCSRLQGVNGSMELAWKKNALELRQCALDNALLGLSARGRAMLAANVGDSSLDLRAVLRLAPEHLRRELTPARTLRSFETKGEARVRVNGVLRRPSVELQS